MKNKTDFHAHDDIKVGSERSFGLVFAAVFGNIALLPTFSPLPPLPEPETMKW